MKRLLWGTQTHICPRCGGREVRRSRKRGLVEQLVSRILSIHPYRCEECDHRHYRVRLTQASRQTAHRRVA